MERPAPAVGVVCARVAVVEATVRARSMAHGRDVRLADRALPDHFGRPPLRRRMVCRTRLLSCFLDARVGRPAFRNRLALCAARSFRDGAKTRTRSAADDDGRVIGLDRARDESTAGQYRHERRCGSRWMARPTPDLDEVKATLAQIRNSAYRARDLIG